MSEGKRVSYLKSTRPSNVRDALVFTVLLASVLLHMVENSWILAEACSYFPPVLSIFLSSVGAIYLVLALLTSSSSHSSTLQKELWRRL